MNFHSHDVSSGVSYLTDGNKINELLAVQVSFNGCCSKELNEKIRKNEWKSQTKTAIWQAGEHNYVNTCCKAEEKKLKERTIELRNGNTI